MYARVATFEGGNLEQLRARNDEAIASGTMNLPDGLTRGMLLNDEAKDRHLFVSFFESREAIDAAQARFEAMGDEIGEEMRGRRTGVDVYEVVWEHST